MFAYGLLRLSASDVDANLSRQKCLIWTTEWIAPDRERKIRTCLESCRVAEAYDRFYPLPKEERRKDEDQGHEE